MKLVRRHPSKVDVATLLLLTGVIVESAPASEWWLHLLGDICLLFVPALIVDAVVERVQQSAAAPEPVVLIYPAKPSKDLADAVHEALRAHAEQPPTEN